MRHCACAIVFSLLAFSIPAEEVLPDDGKIESPTLKKQFEKLAGEILKNKDDKVPPGVTEADLKKAILDHAQSTGVMKVTADEEKALAGGKFDDEKNAAKMKESINILLKKEAPVSLAMMFAINKFQAGELKGAMLEACTRMMQERTARIK
jgi:hypothetical protein